jgi:hypothetical protein
MKFSNSEGFLLMSKSLGQLALISSSRRFPYARAKVLCSYIPEADPYPTRAPKMRVRMSKRSTMLRIQLALAITVNVANICFTLWAIIVHPPDSRAVGTLSVGNCSTMNSINSGLHVALNILSSLLLSAGNYCMQILVAPSRDEVDRAHAKGDSMDIGVPSVRNLWNIERKRVVAWFILGTVATVLHLL